jgi:hypothetical protein
MCDVSRLNSCAAIERMIGERLAAVNKIASSPAWSLREAQAKIRVISRIARRNVE